MKIYSLKWALARTETGIELEQFFASREAAITEQNKIKDAANTLFVTDRLSTTIGELEVKS